MKTSVSLWTILLMLLAVGFDATLASGGLQPFPLSANQRGTVTCLAFPSYSYDIYLPPTYTTNGPALPIFYTMYASGGGMVSTFTNACSNLNVIVVGITGTHNNYPWDKIMREIYADTFDIRHRVRFDPTAEFVGGESGGGECSYMFSRIRAQHVSGLFEMAGWLARENMGASIRYYGVDRVQTNLFIARTTGTNTSSPDTGSIFYNPLDGAFLTNCGAVINDFYFNGGHSTPPEALKIPCLSWLLSQRTPAGPYDESNSLVMVTNWQAETSAGQQETVLRQCVNTLLDQPRTWFAYQAGLTLDDLLTNYTVFRTLNVSNLAQGDFASDMFYYYARGAATNGDWARYNSCMKALTGITVTNDFDGTTTITGIDETVIFPTINASIYIATTNGDRAGDFYNLLTNYNHYPHTIIQDTPPDPVSGQITVSLTKDTPGLGYTLFSTTVLINNPWETNSATGIDTNTIWYAGFIPDNPNSEYYRVQAAPAPAWSPPWVVQ